MKRFVDAVVCAGALCAALATGGCWWLFGDPEDEDESEQVDTDDDPVTCDDEGYWPGDYTISDYFDIQALAGCRYVQGDLRIEGTGLSDLHGLESLETIGGSLWIANNPDLESLDGLDRLFEVDRHVFVTENGALDDVDGLGGLVAVGGSIEMSWSPSLISLDGLDGLRFLDGDLLIFHDDALVALPELPHLAAALGVAITSNASLESVAGLAGLESVERYVQISANPSLVEIDALPALETIGESLRIEQNGRLERLAGFGALASVGKHLFVDGAPGVDGGEPEAPIGSVTAFGALESVGGFVALVNLGLTDLSFLSSLDAVGGDLSVGTWNPNWDDPDGLLPPSGAVGGSVVIYETGFLADLGALDWVGAIGGDLEIWWNPALGSLHGLEALQALGGEDLVIVGNPIEYCEAEELATRLVANGFDGEVDISGTGTTECGEADAGAEADGGLDGGA